MQWILDGVTAVILLGCAFAAWRRGLLQAILGFVPMLFALLGAKAISPYVAKFLRETFLFPQLSNAIQKAMGLDRILREGAMQTQTALIEEMPLPTFLQEVLLENNNPVIYQLLHAESLQEYVSGYLANVCINTVSVLVAFALLYAAAQVVIRALHLFSRLPGLNFLNRCSGFLVGCIKGLVCVWLVDMVLTFFQCRGAFPGIFSAMEHTVLAGFLYENNILLRLILRIFT